jgi:hypothetical protein
MIYERVLDGAVIDARDYGDDEPEALVASKGRWLERVEVRPACDEALQVLEGPTMEVGEAAVTYTWTVRDKSPEEMSPILDAHLAQLEAEYRRRNALPFEAVVDGVVCTWHGDDEGMTNIRDVLQGIVMGVVPDPRPWKPYEQDLMAVSHDGFRAIMVAYSTRKELHFMVLQGKKAAVRALAEDPAALMAFDPFTGW